MDNVDFVCNKSKLSKLDAMIALGESAHRQKICKGTGRKEIRYYYCKQCECYHLTSKEFVKYESSSENGVEPG